jgi:hypothetical protein
MIVDFCVQIVWDMPFESLATIVFSLVACLEYQSPTFVSHLTLQMQAPNISSFIWNAASRIIWCHLALYRNYIVKNSFDGIVSLYFKFLGSFCRQHITPIYCWILPPVWCSGQSSWLQVQRSRVWFPALAEFPRRSDSGMGSTQPREYNWATWMEK